MITYTWKILDLFATEDKLVSVRYLLTGTDGTVTVESEGQHIFSDKIPNKKLSSIVESEILYWLEDDTTQDGINPIKLAIENQLNSLGSQQKVDFPWLAGTFTIN